MKRVGGNSLREHVAAAKKRELIQAFPHGLLNLAGIGADKNASASANLQIAKRHAFKKEGMKGVSDKDRHRKITLTAEFARAYHDIPRANVASERSRMRSPLVVKPSSSTSPSWRSQLMA